MTNIGNVLKSRDIILSIKSFANKSFGLYNSHVQVCELYHKETEHLRIDAFENYGAREEF